MGKWEWKNKYSATSNSISFRLHFISAPGKSRNNCKPKRFAVSYIHSVCTLLYVVFTHDVFARNLFLCVYEKINQLIFRNFMNNHFLKPLPSQGADSAMIKYSLTFQRPVAFLFYSSKLSITITTGYSYHCLDFQPSVRGAACERRHNFLFYLLFDDFSQVWYWGNFCWSGTGREIFGF